MTTEQKLREALRELIEAYNRAGPDLSRSERAVDRLRLIAAHEALSLSAQAVPDDCTRSHPHENMSPMCELRTQIARLTNENTRLKAAQAVPDERDKVDAQRYRWLRLEHERDDPICHLTWKRNSDRSSGDWVNTALLDAAIDAAIAASAKGGAA